MIIGGTKTVRFLRMPVWINSYSDLFRNHRLPFMKWCYCAYVSFSHFLYGDIKMWSNKKNAVINSLVLIHFFFITATSVVFAQMPPNASLPPCAVNQVEDQACLEFRTLPNGEQICAPGGMQTICIPDVSIPGITEEPNVFQCRRDMRKCVDTAPFKMINSARVTLAMAGGCWKWRNEYTCSTDNVVNNCEEFENNPSCNVYSRQCLDQSGPFGCMEWEIEYRCITKPGHTQQIEFCGDTNVCVGGICWDTGYPPDGDFIEVITNMETARQVGVYSPDGLDIFKGEASICRSKRGAGLKNCCSTDTSGSAHTNNAIIGDFVSGSVGYSAKVGTKFVLDSLYGDTVNWIGSGMSAAAHNLPGGAGFIDSISNPSFSFYGLSVGGTGTFLGTSGFQIGQGVYFNPYAFAASIAIQVIMSAMTCNEDEAMLALRRGASLCSPKIGDWCDKRVLGVCITRKRSYCCYNSKFAKIINVQGRQQLGMGWGDSKSPSCAGFTAGQLKNIDFRHIDMTELIDDIMGAYDPSFINTDRSNATQNVENMKDELLRDYCDRAASANPGGILPIECQ